MANLLGVNKAEIEIGVMRRQCLDRRIDNRDLLKSEVDAWERRRTESGAKNPMDVLDRPSPRKNGQVLSNSIAQRVIISATER
jgi:hypothetical protein